MEEWEIEKIKNLSKENKEVELLYEKHLEYEKRIKELQSKPYLTQEEQIELKRLKLEKLRGKDKLFEILRKYEAEGKK